jgi:hypothetical protein
MEMKRVAYRVLVRKAGEEDLRKWNDNIKMHFNRMENLALD